MRKFAIKPSKQYRKDYKRLLKSGLDVRKLETIIEQLASEIPLPDRCRDHALHGELAGRRECHIGPDWLLIYRKDHEALVLLLLSTGAHRDVMGIE